MLEARWDTQATLDASPGNAWQSEAVHQELTVNVDSIVKRNANGPSVSACEVIV